MADTAEPMSETARYELGKRAWLQSLMGHEDAEFARENSLPEALVTECRLAYDKNWTPPTVDEALNKAVARAEQERRARDKAVNFLNQAVTRYEMHCLSSNAEGDPSIPPAEQIRLAAVLYNCYLNGIKVGLDIDKRYSKYFGLDAPQKFEFSDGESKVDKAIQELSGQFNSASQEEDTPL